MDTRIHTGALQGAKPSWYSWLPTGTTGATNCAMHSLTWATVAFPDAADDTWSMSNPYVIISNYV